MSPVYWRPIVTTDYSDRTIVKPACLQDFDEHDYNQSRFLNETEYQSEEECQEFCDRVTFRIIEAGATVASLDKQGLSGKAIGKRFDDDAPPSPKLNMGVSVAVYWKDISRGFRELTVLKDGTEIHWDEFTDTHDLFQPGTRYRLTIIEE